MYTPNSFMKNSRNKCHNKHNNVNKLHQTLSDYTKLLNKTYGKMFINTKAKIVYMYI